MIRSTGFLPTLALIAAVGVLAIGCRSDSDVCQGTVAFTDGEPVRSGSIELRSIADGDQYASRIGNDGSFALTDKDGNLGCPAGQYEVVVVQIVLTEHLAAEDHDHGTTVPRRYADYYTSGLRVDVEAGQPLRIVLESS